jgi:cobalt transporter subunit CbtB
MNTSSLVSATVPRARASSLALSLLGAVLLGALIVFATGFSNISAAHNAAHDMRHSNAFPCH